MTTNPDLFVFAGETSGDLHGEALIKSLWHLDPNLRICGVGGPKMRPLNFNCLLPMEEFQVMGFLDVFLALPRIYKHFFFLAKKILKNPPKALVFIDYPGFSLRLEKYLRKKGFQGKIIHYICPSVWAHGKKRIKILENNVDLLLSIFPFEKKYFSPAFPIHYVGNPLITRIADYPYKPLSWAAGKKVISLFPGSRKKEIELNFPLQLKALKKLLASEKDYIGAVAVAQKALIPLLESHLKKEQLDLKLVFPEETYELMANSFLAIAKSGTVTLELALHKVPTVVIYKIRPLDLFIAQKILKVDLPFYCLVNIIAEKEIFKELIGPNATEENLNKEVQLLCTEPYQKKKKELCEELPLILGSTKTGETAAPLILKSLYDGRSNLLTATASPIETDLKL